jgi:hypothetical protein
MSAFSSEADIPSRVGPKRKSRGDPPLTALLRASWVMRPSASARIRSRTRAFQNLLVFGTHCRKRRAEDRNKQSRVPEIVKVLEGGLHVDLSCLDRIEARACSQFVK